MKKYKNLVIGGIENKLFNMILITTIVLLLTFTGMTVYQGNMLKDLTQNTSEQQKEAITGITSSIMDEVVRRSMDRTTLLEAQLADQLFHDLGVRVEMLEEYAEKLLDGTAEASYRSYAGPNADLHGEVTTQLFLADGTYIDGALDRKIAEKMGFDACYPVSGQTYSRKIDYTVLSALAAIAQSAHKFSNDIRLLQHLKEIEEPFEKNQIGSSAMAYKRNPMRSERIASLSRYVIADVLNPAMTSSEQWFERTLDDSANKRISVPEAFLAVDAILGIYTNVVSGLVVYPKIIEKHINDELPFMMTENIMMEATKKGGNRQELHEEIRQLSMQAGSVVKNEGKPNDLLERIAADPKFGMTMDELLKLRDAKLYIGRCPEQVDAFLTECVRPLIAAHKDDLEVSEVELKV